MNSKPARLVECVGLPGAGKTTLCFALLGQGGWAHGNLLNTQLWRSWSLGHRLRLTAAALFWEVRTVGAVLRAIAALGMWRKPRSALRAMQLPLQRYWLKQQLERDRCNTGKGLLLDQGIGMVLWSVLDEAGCHSPSPAATDRLVERLYRDVAVGFLFLEADHVTASRRIAERRGGSSRFDGLQHEIIVARLAPTAGLLRRIENALAKIGVTTQALDATLSPEALAAQTAATVGGSCGLSK
jgi:hypothetical protein